MERVGRRVEIDDLDAVTPRSFREMLGREGDGGGEDPPVPVQDRRVLGDDRQVIVAAGRWPQGDLLAADSVQPALTVSTRIRF
jgi:hypothetical protein